MHTIKNIEIVKTSVLTYSEHQPPRLNPKCRAVVKMTSDPRLNNHELNGLTGRGLVEDLRIKDGKIFADLSFFSEEDVKSISLVPNAKRRVFRDGQGCISVIVFVDPKLPDDPLDIKRRFGENAVGIDLYRKAKRIQREKGISFGEALEQS